MTAALKTWQPVWAPLTVYNRICPECSSRWQDGPPLPAPWIAVATCPGCHDWLKGRAELDRERAMLFYYQKKRPRGWTVKARELEKKVRALKSRYPGTYDKRRLSA